MTTSSSKTNRFRAGSLIALMGILILTGLTSLWAIRYFSAEARVNRASLRIIQLVEKSGEESPVSLGLAANRLGKMLAPHIVFSLEEIGLFTEGRQETVHWFAQIRQSTEVMKFEHPQLTLEVMGKERIWVRVVAQYQVVGLSGEPGSGKGRAALEWIKGQDGWQITRADLQAEEGGTLPKGWE